MKNQKPLLTLLEPETIRCVIEEAYEVLSQIGVVIEDEETLDLLCEMGAKKGVDGRLRLSRQMVEYALASVPKKIVLYDLDGKETFAFGDGDIHFNPGSAALFIYELSNSTMRHPKILDVVGFTKLSHTLENIEANSTGLIPDDVPQRVSDSIRLYISCLFSTKPVVTGTFSESGFDVMRDILLARTGKESLRSQPCAIFDVCPSSPLRWSKLACHDLKHCAQNAIPAELIAMPMPGALAPMSLLGTIVQHTAENLSGIVIHQGWAPGSPIIYGGSPALFDMRHSTSAMGAIETLLIDLAYAEVGKSLDLPTQAYLGMSDSKTLDAQAGMETAMTIVAASAGKIDFVSGPGMINFESCQSLEKLVIDNQICGMAKRFKKGLAANGTPFGIEAIGEGIKQGDFLTIKSTVELYRKETYYPSSIIDRSALRSEGKVDSERLAKKVSEEVKTRLSRYRKPQIDSNRLQDMKKSMGKALKPFGLEKLASDCIDI